MKFPNFDPNHGFLSRIEAEKKGTDCGPTFAERWWSQRETANKKKGGGGGGAVLS